MQSRLFGDGSRVVAIFARMATFAEQMVTSLETALASNVGISKIKVGDTETEFSSRKQMLEQYQYWQRVVAKEQGTKPVAKRIKLDSLL